MKKSLRNERYSISTRVLLILVLLGLLLSFLVAFLTSKNLSSSIGLQTQTRDLEALSGALESGPLAIARLNSANYAQSELDILMSNPSFRNRGIASVIIQGGENREFVFAKWVQGSPVAQQCLSVNKKEYRFSDSLNPYVISVGIDNCFLPPETTLINSYLRMSGLLQAALTVLILALALWPLAASIRRAEIFMSKLDTCANSTFIPLASIRNLVDLAQRAKKLERDVAIANLASQVAHDIRSPISALNLVIGSLAEIPDEKARLIKSAIKRINDIASNLLSKTKDTIQLTISVERSVDFASTVEAIVREKSVMIEARGGIQFSTEMPKEKVYYSRISENDLHSILSNLIDNALESLVGGVGNVSVVMHRKKRFMSIEIKDNGKGMEPADLKRLGEHGFTSGKPYGNGLGVSNAIKIINEAGGQLIFESELGCGTTAKVSIPIHTAD